MLDTKNVRELTSAEIDLIAGGDHGETMWVSDIFVMNGEQMLVYKELKHGPDGWVWTGEWKPFGEPKTVSEG